MDRRFTFAVLVVFWAVTFWMIYVSNEERKKRERVEAKLNYMINLLAAEPLLPEHIGKALFAITPITLEDGDVSTRSSGGSPADNHRGTEGPAEER